MHDTAAPSPVVAAVPAAAAPATAGVPGIPPGLAALAERLAGGAAVSGHVPQFGLLDDAARAKLLRAAHTSTGSATALPPRPAYQIPTPIVIAIVALSLAGGLLARAWGRRIAVRAGTGDH